jgi:hypothetical protein
MLGVVGDPPVLDENPCLDQAQNSSMFSSSSRTRALRDSRRGSAAAIRTRCSAS